MAKGGLVGFETVDWFNGGLFDDDTALVRDGGSGRAEHGDDHRGEVEMTLVNGPHDAGEQLLGVGAVARAIASADFAGDDAGPVSLFGAPVGRVNQRVPEESEDRRLFRALV